MLKLLDIEVDVKLGNQITRLQAALSLLHVLVLGEHETQILLACTSHFLDLSFVRMEASCFGHEGKLELLPYEMVVQ